MDSKFIDTMDELNRARSELDLLENKEKDLLENLLHTCKAIKENRKTINAQKAKIDELVSKGPPAIHRLPTELLSRIFTFCIPDPKFPEQPLHQIVGVSRHWRDIVLNDAAFWTSIKVTETQKLSLLKAQLKRSRSAPLYVWVEELYQDHAKLLDILVPHVERWRALIIRRNPDAITKLVIQKINRLRFPSLRRLSIHCSYCTPSVTHPALSPTCVPALQHLSLKYHPLCSPTLTPSQSLTSLILAGDSEGWSFTGNTLHFPLLEELGLHVSMPIPFLEAIIAPNLEDPPYTHTQEWRAPLDQWQNLAALVLQGISNKWLYNDSKLDRNAIVEWLRRRQELGQPRLRVRMIDIWVSHEDSRFPKLCGLLRAYCDLELEHVFTELAGSPIQLDLGDLVSDFIGNISKAYGGTDDLRDAWRDHQMWEQKLNVL
ncbi:hypothetical protein SCLCIDRAFT_979586 [Scleroderma citrinum Foug A]|uniref:F-box domain-containing protein n=1 Tax=Scleroderma citrinum Foug A TaxID=1036808 RepID=A0A0C3A5D4_9AGAM|nr:hypothetical protein SCLCIDRAFT_979586 [Scleroderma citrinum Foug A]